MLFIVKYYENNVFSLKNNAIENFFGGGKVFYVVIFMRFLRLLNYHVKISP